MSDVTPLALSSQAPRFSMVTARITPPRYARRAACPPGHSPSGERWEANWEHVVELYCVERLLGMDSPVTPEEGPAPLKPPQALLWLLRCTRRRPGRFDQLVDDEILTVGRGPVIAVGAVPRPGCGERW